MTTDVFLTLAILAIAVVLFVSERLRVDLVALLVLATLAFSGLLTPAEAVSGFSNEAVVTIWAVFILSAGLSRTGVANIVGKQVLRLAGTGEVQLMVVIMLTTGIMSAFMNNIGVAALLLPVVMDIARRTRRAPGRLLMPLSFGALLGGLTTLIGTSPNILASTALQEAGLEPFALFDFAPVGGIIFLAGVAFMAVVGRHLLPESTAADDGTAGGEHPGEPYALEERLYVLNLPTRSSLAGRTLVGSRVGTALGLNVVGIIRNGRTRLAPGPEMVLQGGDRLLVTGHPERLATLQATQFIIKEDEELRIEDLADGDVRLGEVSLSAHSPLVNRTLHQIDFRRRYGANVLAIWHNGTPRRTDLQDIPLKPGAVMLVQGTVSQFEALRESADFLVSSAEIPGIYRLEERLLTLYVPQGSHLAGQSLQESRLGDAFDLLVLGLVREGETHLMPSPDLELAAGDVLLVQGKAEDLAVLRALQELEVEAAPREVEQLESAGVGMVEAVLSPHASLAGKTLRDLYFREKYDLSVLAIWRAGRAYRSGLRDIELHFGDALLLYGQRDKLKILARDPAFIVLDEALQEPVREEKAPIAALIMGAVIFSVLIGFLPISVAAVSGAALMVLSGCLQMEEAYRNIQWNAVFLIAGMLPLGIAMEQSGAAQTIAEGMVNSLGALGPMALLAGLFVFTNLASQMIPNLVVVVLMAPIALTAAADLNLSPHALMMSIAVASAASFLSPVGHPVNVLVMGPGGYRVSDYLRVGLPLTLVVVLISLLVLPIVWPLQ